MIMKTPQRKPKQKSKGFVKSKRDVFGSSVGAENILINSENSKANEGSNYLQFFKSLSKKNNKGEISYSSKYEHNRNTKSKSKTHSTKATKNDRNFIQQVSHFEQKIMKIERKNKNKKNQKVLIDSPFTNKQFINQILEERQTIVDKKKLANNFMEKSLQLFNLNKQNLQKRKNLLNYFKNGLNQSWKKQLYNILQNKTNDNSQQIIQQAIKMLVAQRQFIQQENKKMDHISTQIFRI